MLQPFIDKALKHERIDRSKRERKKADRARGGSLAQNAMANGARSRAASDAAVVFAMSDREEEDGAEDVEDDGDVFDEEKVEIEKSQSNLGAIPSGELSVVRVSSVFGHVLCYSRQTKDLFLYSSAGELLSYSNSGGDVYNALEFSRSGKHIVSGGEQKIVRIKALPSFKTL